MKHIICYSGGHSSALVAIEVVRKFGKETVVLLNHDISSFTEDQDIKRFKQEVSEYLGIPITYCNIKGITEVDLLPDQFDVCAEIKAFKVGKGTELCTSKLKTEPFMKYLKENFSDKECVLYYGFDMNETARIQRRSSILGNLGYKSDYPLALWKERTINSTSEVGIDPPLQYGTFKHGNCFSGDTLFITSGGTLKLSESVGKQVEVITRDGWKDATVVEFGQQEIVEVVFTNGNRKKIVKTTTDHRWILPKHNHKSFGYTEKSTMNLVSGDIIPTVYSLPSFEPDRLGIQHGFTFGDGSTYQTSYKDGKFKARAYVANGKEEIEEYFDGIKTGGKNINGLPAEWKCTPLITDSKEYLLGFIVGLVASDGCVSKSGITISNKSRENLLIVNDILNKLGMVSWVSKSIVRDTNYKKGATICNLTIPKSSFKLEWLIRNFHKERYGDKRTEPKSWKVESITRTGAFETVYCAVVEGDFKEFTLDGNMLTGNCKGCLKAGRQHWYIIYCERKDIWEKAKATEELIGYSIIKDVYLEELEIVFEEMKCKGIPRTEHIKHQTFWAEVRKAGIDTVTNEDRKPCECTF